MTRRSCMSSAANDCVFGAQTNEQRAHSRSAASQRIVADAAASWRLLRQSDRDRVGLRPFRKSGVRAEAGRLSDGRPVVHNYVMAGGLYIILGCAQKVFALAKSETNLPNERSSLRG